MASGRVFVCVVNIMKESTTGQALLGKSRPGTSTSACGCNIIASHALTERQQQSCTQCHRFCDVIQNKPPPSKRNDRPGETVGKRERERVGAGEHEKQWAQLCCTTDIWQQVRRTTAKISTRMDTHAGNACWFPAIRRAGASKSLHFRFSFTNNNNPQTYTLSDALSSLVFVFL